MTVGIRWNSLSLSVHTCTWGLQHPIRLGLRLKLCPLLSSYFQPSPHNTYDCFQSQHYTTYAISPGVSCPPPHPSDFYSTSSEEPSRTTLRLGGVSTLLSLHLLCASPAVASRILEWLTSFRPWGTHPYHQSLTLSVFSICGWKPTNMEGCLFA